METTTSTTTQTKIKKIVGTPFIVLTLLVSGASIAAALMTRLTSDSFTQKSSTTQPRYPQNVDVSSRSFPTLFAGTEEAARALRQEPMPIDSGTIIQPTTGRTIYVDNAATGANNGTSPEDAYTTLNAALIDLTNEAGVTISIAKGIGTYEENFTTGPDNFGCAIGGDDSGSEENPNRIIAKGRERPIIQCTRNSGYNNGFLAKNAQWIQIDGLTFVAAELGNRNGFNISNSQNVVFTNNVIQPYNNGITVGFSSNVELTGNTITNSLNGITLYQSVNNTIKSNRVILNKCSGILLSEHSDGNEIEHNLVARTGVGCGINGEEWGGNGIRLNHTSSNNTLFSNTVNDTRGGWYQGLPSNGNGVLVIQNSHSNIMKDSIITNNQRNGVTVEQGSVLATTYTNVWNVGSVDGVGNISEDPLFVLPALDDYHLRCSSISIDHGDPESPYSLEPEPNGERINQGLYGNTPEATQSVCTSATP